MINASCDGDTLIPSGSGSGAGDGNATIVVVPEVVEALKVMYDTPLVLELLTAAVAWLAGESPLVEKDKDDDDDDDEEEEEVMDGDDTLPKLWIIPPKLRLPLMPMPRLLPPEADVPYVLAVENDVPLDDEEDNVIVINDDPADVAV